MHTEALLFDLDGTLTDSDPLHFESFARIAADYSVDMDEEMFLTSVSGQANARICDTLFPHVDKARRYAIADEKEALFRRMIVGRLEPIPGLVDLLDWAGARGCGLALVSNAPRANVTDMLAQLGISDRFQVILAGGEVARSKPDPLPYLTALDRLGVAPSRAVVFEDAPPGLKAAHASGAATVGLTTTLDADAVRSFGADLAVADYRDAALLPFMARALAGDRG